MTSAQHQPGDPGARTDPEARTIVYGMPYDEWKAKFQKEATAQQKDAFAAKHKH